MIKKFERAWTKKEWCKSILFFLLHFIIFIGIAAVVLLYDKFSNIQSYMKDHGADYLYALFSIFLIVAIMYFYFLFEDKAMIANGKNISLLFIVLDVYFLFAWFIGGQGGNQNGSDQRSQTEAQSHGLNRLDLANITGQNQLDHDTDQRAGSVDGGDLSCAAVHVGQHVHGEVAHGLEQKEGSDLEDHQHPTAETEVDAELSFLLHTITPQK
jgi:hypothetical protein